MGLFNSKSERLRTAIRFRKPFTEKYTLTIETDIQAGYFPLKTKTSIRWFIEVADVDSEGNAELSLFTLDNLLLETNNPALEDLAALNRAFGKMYSELYLIVNVTGEITYIRNIVQIREKWENTKNEMEKIRKQVPALESLLLLNDEIFNDPEKIKIAITNNEFFSSYFYLFYGAKLPMQYVDRTSNNVLQTNEMNWSYEVSGFPDLPVEHIKNKRFTFTGKSYSGESREWKKKAYGHLPMIDDEKKIKPVFNEKGEALFEAQTGRLFHLQLEREEIVLPEKVFGKVRIELLSDTYKYEREKEKKRKTVPLLRKKGRCFNIYTHRHKEAHIVWYAAGVLLSNGADSVGGQSIRLFFGIVLCFYASRVRLAFVKRHQILERVS